MSNARPKNRRQRGIYGSKLPIDADGAVDNDKIEQQRAAPADYRPQALRGRPVHRVTTGEMIYEARICRGSPTSTYTLGDARSQRIGPAVISRTGWTAVTESEMHSIADSYVDVATFDDGQQRVQRRLRKLEFRHRDTGEPVVLAELPDEILPHAFAS